MDARARGRVTVALGILTALCASGCGGGENISVGNTGDASVTVQLGADDVGEVTAGGGVVLLDVTDCYEGLIVVTYADGRTVELDGPICPGQRLVIGNTTAQILEPSGRD